MIYAIAHINTPFAISPSNTTMTRGTARRHIWEKRQLGQQTQWFGTTHFRSRSCERDTNHKLRRHRTELGAHAFWAEFIIVRLIDLKNKSFEMNSMPFVRRRTELGPRTTRTGCCSTPMLLFIIIDLLQFIFMLSTVHKRRHEAQFTVK